MCNWVTSYEVNVLLHSILTIASFHKCWLKFPHTARFGVFAINVVVFKSLSRLRTLSLYLSLFYIFRLKVSERENFTKNFHMFLLSFVCNKKNSSLIIKKHRIFFVFATQPKIIITHKKSLKKVCDFLK